MKIGDHIWIADCYCEEVFLTCPDCGGDGYIRCIMHDNTEVSVECGACRNSSGRVGYYKRNPKACPGIITGIAVETCGGVQKTEYTVESEYNRRVGEDRIFLTLEEAKERSLQIAEIENEEEKNRILKKEKDSKSWAWNASYHRKKIRDAERDIQYHSAKLVVAKLKAKEGV